ncbi:MAG: DUF4198 domain-containing protein [Thermodesulfovibrio sp.]|nr:DUF4198 domain-containing protein [Thermodesulfovibrio sp.]MDW7972445.1 DUF4198 domain-containing protein [Thermodesulfovibrio sp.]
MKNFRAFLVTKVFLLFILHINFLYAHDRWLQPVPPIVEVGKDVNIEFCVGHGFESEAAPSEWWLTQYYLIDPDGNEKKLLFSYNKEKQKSATTKFTAKKRGTYMIYSKAENIYWVKTKDGKYLQFKDKIQLDPSEIKRTFIGWQYSKTFVKVDKSGGDSYKKTINSLIELVPLNDPTNLKVGDSLSLRILTHGKDTKWNVAVIALYKGFPGDVWSYSYFTEYPGEIYAKEGIEKEPIIKIPITNKGLWFVKAFRMMDEEILCKKKYGEHDAYFFEFTLTFYVP